MLFHVVAKQIYSASKISLCVFNIQLNVHFIREESRDCC